MEAYRRLEMDFGSWNNVDGDNMVACASGTAALHLALEALQLPPGSKVVIPEFTMVACARAVTMAGLVPVFVDCDNDLLMDLEQASTLCERPSVRAIMVVHVYGRQCNMETVAAIAKATGVAVIEDLAEAHGIKPHDESEAACWSFYKNKIVHGEEGGAVCFKYKSHAERARKLRSLGFTDDHNFQHIPRGVNARMSNAHAALIFPSLEQAGANLIAREHVCSMYDAILPKKWHMRYRDVCWVYDLRIPGMTSTQQDAVIRRLLSDGIPARHAFKPMSHQAEYRCVNPEHRLNAERLSREVIYIPCFPDMQLEGVQYACRMLEQAVATLA